MSNDTISPFSDQAVTEIRESLANVSATTGLSFLQEHLLSATNLTEIEHNYVNYYIDSLIAFDAIKAHVRNVLKKFDGSSFETNEHADIHNNLQLSVTRRKAMEPSFVKITILPDVTSPSKMYFHLSYTLWHNNIGSGHNVHTITEDKIHSLLSKVEEYLTISVNSNERYTNRCHRCKTKFDDKYDYDIHVTTCAVIPRNVAIGRGITPQVYHDITIAGDVRVRSPRRGARHI